MGKDKIHWRISAEDVLAVLEYYNAASLKAQQTALSGTATQLEKLLGGPLHKLLEPEEADAIRKSGEIVRSINIRVEHAKEIKRREEKQREARLKARKALIDAEIRAAIPRPQATAENVIGVWGAMEPKTNVSSESHRKGAFRSPAHPPGITL